jgi:hypothetical protein
MKPVKWVLCIFALVLITILLYRASSSKKFKIGPSKIHGNGVICTRTIQKGERIGIAFTRNLETQEIFITPDFGVFLNHKVKSNIRFIMVKQGDIEVYYSVAIQTISVGEEITVNYDGEDVPYFIEGSKPEYIS